MDSKNKDLYESISIKPEGLPSIANQNHNRVRYNYIRDLHSNYQQIMKKIY